MDKVIVTALLIIGAVTAAVVVIITITPAISMSSQSVVESNREYAARLQTDIEIIAVAPDSTGTQIDVWVKNVGVIPILAIDKSDVFVITSGSRFDALTYAPGGDNTWIESPVGSSWNRSDTLHLKLTLPAANPLSVGSHRLVVSTSNGASSERFFSR